METITALFTIIGGFLGSFITYVIFKLERKDKFRMAAIEKRLEAHQKAYAQYIKIIEVMDSLSRDDVNLVMKDTRLFLADYSLYLEQGTRKMFIAVLGFLNAFCPLDDYLDKFKDEDRGRAFDKYQNKMEDVETLGYLIQKEVQLEPIAIKPAKPIKKLTN